MVERRDLVRPRGYDHGCHFRRNRRWVWMRDRSARGSARHSGQLLYGDRPCMLGNVCGVSRMKKLIEGVEMKHLAVAICVGALLWMSSIARAQAPATTSSGASTSSKSSVKVEMVPSLFVMNARGANLQGQTLTLAGVSPTSIVFADRPVRAAGHLPTEAAAGGMDHRRLRQGRPECHRIGAQQGWCFGPRRRCRAEEPASRRRPADLRCARAGG